MPKDKSLFHYGKTYHKFIDPLMKPSWEKVIEFIHEGSSVLDIGCGTGVLCSELHQRKGCRVSGADLSLTMIHYALEHNLSSEVRFVHQDATDLADFEDKGFDYAVMAFLIHELFPEDQVRAVKEAWRVARQVIFVDSVSPLPWNLVGLIKRMIEVVVGFEHYPQFRAYISSGGMTKILEAAGLEDRVVHQEIFAQGCHQIVAIAH